MANMRRYYEKKFASYPDIHDLHPHKLRHTFASVAITSGAAQIFREAIKNAGQG